MFRKCLKRQYAMFYSSYSVLTFMYNILCPISSGEFPSYEIIFLPIKMFFSTCLADVKFCQNQNFLCFKKLTAGRNMKILLILKQAQPGWISYRVYVLIYVVACYKECLMVLSITKVKLQ